MHSLFQNCLTYRCAIPLCLRWKKQKKLKQQMRKLGPVNELGDSEDEVEDTKPVEKVIFFGMEGCAHHAVSCKGTGMCIACVC